MFKLYSFLATAVILFSCNTKSTSGTEDSLDKLFIQSLKENKFEVLENNLATKELYRFIVPAKDTDDAFIDKFIRDYKLRIRESWNKVAEIVKTKKIDFSKLQVKEWLVHNPFKDKEKDVQGAVLVYDYDGKTWDDLSFLVATMKNKTYLLEIPNPTKAFSFADTTLRSRSDAMLYHELKDTAFIPKLQTRVNEMIQYAKENKIQQLTENAVYNGDDENRKWKSAMNPSDIKDFERGSFLIKAISGGLENCDYNYTFGTMDYDRESEGVWIVQKVNCGSKIIYFAFLKIDNKFLLGDVNIE
jgi:hypothetical protein